MSQRIITRSKRRSFCEGLSLTLISGFLVGVKAQTYQNYDGSAAKDLASAAATWSSASEFQLDWGLGAMNAQWAYARGLSGKGVKLGAVDSGLRLTHQEFARRGANAVRIAGNYLDKGSFDAYGLNRPWSAGQAFDVSGGLIPDGINDGHGSHVSGTIAAAKDGEGMMGVAFGSDYYISNTNTTDRSIYGPNMDHNYFKLAYRNQTQAGVRATNTSWGVPGPFGDVDTVDVGAANYTRHFVVAGKKTWFDALIEVGLEGAALQVFAAGNSNKDHASIRSMPPYFRPELERHWLSVAALDEALKPASFSNRCGYAKYWCLIAPGVKIQSLDFQGDDQYKASNGTSMSAPHVTGALGLLMERYPGLDNQAIRTILLTTAKHLGDGDPQLPNLVYGWGIPDLDKAMGGPAQLLGTFNAHIPQGSERWAQPISQAALDQRKLEEAAEIADWPKVKAQLQASVEPVPEALPTAADVAAGIAKARELLKEAVRVNTTKPTLKEMAAALDPLKDDAVGAQLLTLFEFHHPTQWGASSAKARSPVGIYDFFIAGRSDAQLANDVTNSRRLIAQARNSAVQAAIAGRQQRVNALVAKTAADYVGSLVKTGAGELTLAGVNTYRGRTQVQSGTLRTGASQALAMSPVTVASGATLDITGSGNATLAALSSAGLVNMADGVAGQTLTVNGAWEGRSGTLRLDIAMAQADVVAIKTLAEARSTQSANDKAATGVIHDQLVVNGPVSGVTAISLSGLQKVSAAALSQGLTLIASQQPLPSRSFVLDAPLVVEGQTHTVQIVGNKVLLKRVIAPASAQPVPVFGGWGLAGLSLLMAGWAHRRSRRCRRENNE